MNYLNKIPVNLETKQNTKTGSLDTDIEDTCLHRYNEHLSQVSGFYIYSLIDKKYGVNDNS